jgi:hypothetical protein
MFQPGAELHMKPLSDHLEEFREKSPIPRRKAGVLQHLFPQRRRLDGQKMLAPVQKLQSAMKDNAAGHDAGYYRRLPAAGEVRATSSETSLYT